MIIKEFAPAYLVNNTKLKYAVTSVRLVDDNNDDVQVIVYDATSNAVRGIIQMADDVRQMRNAFDALGLEYQVLTYH